MESMLEEYRNAITTEMIEEAKKEKQALVDDDDLIWLATPEAMLEILCDDFVFIEGAKDKNKTVQQHVKESFPDVNFDSDDLYLTDNYIIEYEKINLGVEV